MRSAYVLIAEHDPDTLAFSANTLRDAEYEVSTARRAERAWFLLGRRRPDFLILDLELTGTSGWKVLDRLRSESVLASVPVLVTTASAVKPMRADVVLRKPYSHDRLLAAMRELWQRAPRTMQQRLRTRSGLDGYDEDAPGDPF